MAKEKSQKEKNKVPGGKKSTEKGAASSLKGTVSAAKETTPSVKGTVSDVKGKAPSAKGKASAVKSAGEELRDRLTFTPKNSWEFLDAKAAKEVEPFSVDYRVMLDYGKTEREFVLAAAALLKKEGFREIDPARDGGKHFSPGSRVFQRVKGKALLAAVVGNRGAAEGLNILGAHVDSPRLDLKQNPLYEEGELAFFDTHYYGGIKKYQWTAVPLSMHGVFVDAKGNETSVRLGEDEADPVFTVTDLLPHLAQDQMQKKGAEVVEGEDLDVLAGSRPYVDEKVKEKVKLRLLQLLYEKYGITERSFASAEIEFVPAYLSRDLGFDRSMIGAYGHDDRSCAYPALRAIIDIAREKEPPKKTSLLYLSDKEEIGSFGNTGAQSWGFENFVAALAGEENLRRCLANSSMLSADVSAAFDPAYASVFDKKNCSYLGKGLVLTKYTGSRGKAGASDANAEFCARVQAVMDNNKVPWQFGELGKVDKGGGGTIALHAAKYGIEVLDCGVPVLSMHSPFEVISKVDLYNTYRAYAAFLRDM